MITRIVAINIGIAALWPLLPGPSCFVAAAAAASVSPPCGPRSAWCCWGLAWPGDSGRPDAPGRPAAAVEAAGHSTLDLVSHAPPAPAPVPEGVHAARLGSETGGDADSDSTAIRRASHRTPWIARVPLWRADALRWQRLEPALRLNPGHAPPYA